MSILTVFRSHLASCQYAFKNGKMAHFIKGAADKPAQYLTDSEDEIKELMAEIKFGHPHLFVPEKDADKTVDTEYDPIETLRAKIRIEERARVLAEMNMVPTSGRSSTGVAPLLGGMANSASLASNVEGVKSAPLIVDSNTGKIAGSDTVDSKLADESLNPQESAKPAEDLGPVDPNAPTDVKLAMTDKLAALKSKA